MYWIVRSLSETRIIRFEKIHKSLCPGKIFSKKYICLSSFLNVSLKIVSNLIFLEFFLLFSKKYEFFVLLFSKKYFWMIFSDLLLLIAQRQQSGPKQISLIFIIFISYSIIWIPSKLKILSNVIPELKTQIFPSGPAI